MNANSPTAFLAYLHAHSSAGEHVQPKQLLPAITISRECGSGAVKVAKIIIDSLNLRRGQISAPPWTVFDRNLAEQILTDHKLPPRVGRYFTEDVTPELRAAFEEFLDLHPSNWTMLKCTNETILRLGRAGHVIIVGRGANMVTKDIQQVFHVRLTAPIEFRVGQMKGELRLSEKETLAHIEKTDRARRRYLRHNFGTDVRNPLLYDLTINTGRVSFQTAAHMIIQGALNRMEEIVK